MTEVEAGPNDGKEASVLAEHLRRTIGNFVRGIRAEADTSTTSQSETRSLLDKDGPLSVAALAASRNVRHQSMRPVVGQLELDGLVSKLPNPEKWRGVGVSGRQPAPVTDRKGEGGIVAIKGGPDFEDCDFN